MKKRIILAITGASGSLYAIEFLKLMRDVGVEVYGVISEAGRKVLMIEEDLISDTLSEMAETWYEINDLAAPIASGSAQFSGMVVLPCSMGTLASISNGISANLIHRAADVTLKERRPLVLAVRESPLNRTHLVNMLQVHDAGATICPLVHSHYHKIDSFSRMARIFCGRIADQFGIEIPNQPRWKGMP